MITPSVVNNKLLSLLPNTLVAKQVKNSADFGGRSYFGEDDPRMTYIITENPDFGKPSGKAAIVQVQSYDAENPDLAVRIYDAGDTKGKWLRGDFDLSSARAWKDCADAISKFMLGGKSESYKEDFVTVKDIPSWAIYYMTYGASDGLTDDEVKQIDSYMERNGLLRGVDVVEDSHNDFCAHPAFGLGSETDDVVFAVKSDKDEAVFQDDELEQTGDLDFTRYNSMGSMLKSKLGKLNEFMAKVFPDATVTSKRDSVSVEYPEGIKATIIVEAYTGFSGKPKFNYTILSRGPTSRTESYDASGSFEKMAYTLLGIRNDFSAGTMTEDEFYKLVKRSCPKESRELAKRIKETGMQNESHKYEATKFGAGMSKRKDFSKCKNLGDILSVLEEHHAVLVEKSKDMTRSKDAIKETLKTLQEFEAYMDLLKQQSTKGIKKAIAFKNSPEVQAASEIEQALKGALSILASDYSNINSISGLMTVIDSRYASQGSRILTTVDGQIIHAVEVDSKTIKDSLNAGDIQQSDVNRMVTLTQVTHGVKDKGAMNALQPIFDRMNAMVNAANKLEEAVIDPKEFEELRDLVKEALDKASAPKETIKTSILALDAKTLADVPRESRVAEGLLDKIKAIVSAITDKLGEIWNAFTSMVFDVDDKASEAEDVFEEVELELAYVGISVTESYHHGNTLGKQFEVLTKSVLHCCDDLVKDASLAGEFDDEVIYAQDAVANAIESFEELGNACKSLKNALNHHKNEDNMKVIGILSDAITQIVADSENDSVDGGESNGGSSNSSDDDDSQSVIDQVEQEYSPEDEEPEEPEEPEENPNAAPNPADMGEPAGF